MSKIEQSWYKPFGLITLLLLPLSALFWVVSSFRKYLYSAKILKPFECKTPVIVVGNISVGGNGKTPFVLWLYGHLTQQGLSVGIISRGYGGQSKNYPLLVTELVDAQQAGDEPVLLYHRLKCPIAVGPNRQHNIDLLENNYTLDVIISDDGMQHYKMPRSIECCIVDSERRFGNGFVMPAGPLRETTKRLQSVDIGIENGGSLFIWKKFFPKAKIIGIDLNPDCKKFEKDGFIIEIGDQNSIKFWKLKTSMPCSRKWIPYFKSVFVEVETKYIQYI